jgi:hypothetical protein
MAELMTNGTQFPKPPGWTDPALTAEVDQLDLRDLLIERGTTGLKRAGGFVREDFLVELNGQQGVRKYREMADNSPVIGGCLFAIQMLVRNVQWSLRPAKDTPEAQQYADLVQAMLFDDLDMPWSLLISEILSFLPFGWSFFELIFKRRLGRTPSPNPDGTRPLPSQFNDGLIGLGKIAPRAQDSLLRWAFDHTGSLLGMHQLDPWMGHQAYIPYEKALLFRPTSYKNSPEGRSILRTAYRPYYLLSHIENTEAVGVEREYTGLPVIHVPAQWMTGSSTPEDLAQLEMVKHVGKNVRNDEQACLILPSLYDAAGNQILRFEFAKSPGTRAFSTDPIIQRHELRITQSVLCDMLFLGHEDVGSFALASSKSTTQAMSLGGYLTVIKDEMNRRCLPWLARLNAWDPALLPELIHGDIESIDLTELARFMLSFGRIYPMADLENHLRTAAGLPERKDAEKHPLPPAILPTGGGEGFHAHGGGSGTGVGEASAVPGTGLPDFDRELSPPSL